MQERAVPLCTVFVFRGAFHADYLCTAADSQLWRLSDALFAMFALKLWHMTWVKENAFHLLWFVVVVMG